MGIVVIRATGYINEEKIRIHNTQLIYTSSCNCFSAAVVSETSVVDITRYCSCWCCYGLVINTDHSTTARLMNVFIIYDWETRSTVASNL